MTIKAMTITWSDCCSYHSQDNVMLSEMKMWCNGFVMVYASNKQKIKTFIHPCLWTVRGSGSKTFLLRGDSANYCLTMQPWIKNTISIFNSDEATCKTQSLLLSGVNVTFRSVKCIPCILQYLYFWSTSCTLRRRAEVHRVSIFYNFHIFWTISLNLHVLLPFHQEFSFIAEFSWFRSFFFLRLEDTWHWGQI